ncbi:hypothetical protein ARMGADRAFT_1093183 [Armillaria gallica]|uniref:Uncharacterized protein n=1 Tax=Armillaria gallica TaxID=47427 RepID=A0A2H3CJN0_ARMGA|nr:hypothetical protein ARMGADRAFT_1093183 [Armillaria gallica]
MIRGANVSFSPTEYIRAVQLFCYSVPRSRSSPCLPFDDLFVEDVQRIDPLPPLKGIVPFEDQRFGWEEECFDFNDRDDNESYFRPSPSKERCSFQRYQEQVEVDTQGARKIVMVLM